ncbi:MULTISPECIES: FtsX-like permease family protein [unclassified Pseudoalteromonas]|uniref:FtsX-like permease family protein n=1 Tax=unclassified Pseudoalteromonas TaxID=194690 RepID=UPI0005AA60A9|nr:MULTISPECIES: FtsX-like permease family protein [unclassified Pseudoalteromonas]
MAILSLAIKSFRNRKFSTLLAVISISLSVALLLGVERVREQTKTSFTSTISGTDLIVGARSSSVNLLLSSVFQMGTQTNGIDIASYQDVIKQPQISWSIPFSFGDSHKGFRVIGTTKQFFEHYKYGKKQNLTMDTGNWFNSSANIVVGATVAKKLNYKLNDKITVSHGESDSHIEHDNIVFTISGILAPTSTPIDRSLYISLQDMDILHVKQNNFERGADPLAALKNKKRPRKQAITKIESHEDYHDNHHYGKHHEEHNHSSEHHDTEHHDTEHHDTEHHDKNTKTDHHQHSHQTDRLSGFYLGLTHKTQALSMMAFINKYDNEALMAIMPGVALLELWSMLSVVEQVLFLISILVVAIALTSMLIILITNLNQRRREMAILRAIGAKPKHILALLVGEVSFIVISGIILGLIILYCVLIILQPFVLSHLGVHIALSAPTTSEIKLIVLMGLASVITSLWPSFQAYRYTLSDGISVKS